MPGWLLGYTFASAAGAFVAVKVFEGVVGNVADGASQAAKGTVFISTWTAITARSGMGSVSNFGRRLRRHNKSAHKALSKRKL